MRLALIYALPAHSRALPILTAFVLTAQAPPAFDVVSVKHSGNMSMSVQTGPGSFTSLTRWWKYSPGN